MNKHKLQLCPKFILAKILNFIVYVTNAFFFISSHYDCLFKCHITAGINLEFPIQKSLNNYTVLSSMDSITQNTFPSQRGKTLESSVTSSNTTPVPKSLLAVLKKYLQ